MGEVMGGELARVTFDRFRPLLFMHADALPRFMRDMRKEPNIYVPLHLPHNYNSSGVDRPQTVAPDREFKDRAITARYHSPRASSRHRVH